MIYGFNDLAGFEFERFKLCNWKRCWDEHGKMSVRVVCHRNKTKPKMRPARYRPPSTAALILASSVNLSVWLLASNASKSVFLVRLHLRRKPRRSGLLWPPGPKRWLIIGNLLQLVAFHFFLPTQNELPDKRKSEFLASSWNLVLDSLFLPGPLDMDSPHHMQTRFFGHSSLF